MRLLPVLFLLIAAAPAYAQSFDQAQRDIDQKLERALSNLAEERARIAKERIPLSRAVSTLEKSVHTLGRERAELAKKSDGHTIDLASLRRQVQ